MRDQRRVRQPPHAEAPHQPGVGERGQRDRAADAAKGEREQLAEAIAGAKDLLRAGDVGDEKAEHEARGDAVAERDAVGEDERQGLADSVAARAGRPSGGCVSGKRDDAQTDDVRPAASSTAKSQRQVPTRMMSWPTAGARIGTRMNTIITIDMTRAICRPTNRSRTIVVTMIRPTDPPIPCRNRAARNCEKLCVVTARIVASTKSARPSKSGRRRPKRSASGPQTSWPMAMPSMKTVTTSGRLRGITGTPSVAPISGSAGSMMSIDIARHRHQQRHQRDELAEWQRQARRRLVGDAGVGCVQSGLHA